MYTLTFDLIEDLCGWRVVAQARRADGRKIRELAGVVQFIDCDAPAERVDVVVSPLLSAELDRLVADVRRVVLGVSSAKG